MLDLHVLYDGTGSTSLIQPATVPANDGVSAAGVPILSAPEKATLVAWGAAGIDATKAIKQVSLTSNDQIDPANTESWLPSGTCINICSPHMLENMPYKTAARVVKAAQKAAGLEFTFTIDHYESNDVRAMGCIEGSFSPAKHGIYSSTFGGALTAQTWGTKALSPTYNLPAGKYAILGFAATALTNVAAIRFQHSDFGSAQPGCLAADKVVIAGTPGAVAGDQLLLTSDMFQFVRLSEMTGKPQCPVFSAGPNGTGLIIWVFDNTADTPTVIVNLAKVD